MQPHILVLSLVALASFTISADQPDPHSTPAIRLAFTAMTDPSGLVDTAQKARIEVAQDLAKDFSKHAQADHVAVVERDADVTITIVHRQVRGGHGLASLYAKNFAGETTKAELRAGTYTTELEANTTPRLAQRIRDWLKENARRLQP